MSHETQVKSNEWYTPEYIFKAIDTTFDLDVASPIKRDYCFVPTQNFITQNSLDQNWIGFVWMNPPFVNQKTKYLWIEKFINHKNGIALMPDRTSAPWWQYFAKNADAILFVDGKIKFIKPDGSKGESPGNGTTLFAIGAKGIQCLKTAEINGLGIFYECNAKKSEAKKSITR